MEKDNTAEIENLILHKRKTLSKEDWKDMYKTIMALEKEERDKFFMTLAGRILVQTYSMIE